MTPDVNSQGVPAFGGGNASEVKKAAAEQRSQVTRTVAEMERKQAAMAAELDRQRRELEAEFQAKRAELEAQMGPLRQQLQRMQEVMWTVDLYLGRDEYLRLLRDGEPAPEGTPITIRQKVLVMAEESLLHMDRRATGMTSDDIPEFVDWLLGDPARLDAVFPEQKGVVVLIPTRVESRTGNVWEDSARDAANSASWWLLRNGERLYMLNVDAELRVTQRVLPRRNEFAEVFDRRLFGFGRAHGEPVKPGSEEWLHMEATADARRRHYMRIMLVLQGIVDRTPVWHPLPASGVNLMSLADQEAGKIVLVQDDEDSIQLTDGRESFRDWQIRLNGLLRPGLRVIGNWATQGFSDLYVDGDRWTRGFHPRMSPKTCAERPAANVPHLLEGRRDGGFVLRFARTEKVWTRDNELVTPERRASCVVMPEDAWVLPYDLVTVSELTYYLGSRDNRSKHFLSMVPTIKAALEAKRAEAELEAPFRDLLGRVLVGEGADEGVVVGLVDELVQWWKVSNAWARPLNGEPEHEAKAVRDISAEYRARVQHGSAEDAEVAVAAGRAIPGVIAVARNRQGKWFGYAPSAPCPDGGVFLDITPIRSDGTLGAAKLWQHVPQRSVSLLHVAWSSAEWSAWQFAANPRFYLTGPEREALVAEVVERAREKGEVPICVTEVFDPREPNVRALVSYSWVAGSPEDAPVRVTSSPLNWRYERNDERLVVCRGWIVTKGKGGARLGGSAAGVVGYPKEFDHYSGGSRWGNTPWWPADAHRYADARPRLAWSDTDMLDRVAAYVARCAGAATEERSAREEFSKDVYRYVNAVLSDIRAAREADAKARFIEDYGHDAMDLWPAHLDSLGLSKDPVHPRTLWGVIAIALEHGKPVVGRTLDDLAAEAWSVHGNVAPGEWNPTGRKAQDMGDFGHVVVPEPGVE